MENNERLCLSCQKVLKGRLDKKFCDDYCRNAYNNLQNSDRNNFVRNINNALRKNRRILEAIIPDSDGTTKITRQKLQEKGFDFKYLTHQYQNQKGNVYNFCYEYGYLPLEGDWLLLVKRK
jgi:hypothetical protein